MRFVFLLAALLGFFSPAVSQTTDSTFVDYYTDATSSMYYLRSSVVLSILRGDSTAPQLTGNEFGFDGSDGLIYVYVSNNGKPMETDEIILDVLRKNGRREILVETLRQNVNRDAKTVVVPCVFREEGRFTLNVYNAHEAWINSTDVTIRFR